MAAAPFGLAGGAGVISANNPPSPADRDDPITLADVHDERLEDVIERLTMSDIARVQAFRSEFVELPCAACRGTRLAPAFECRGFGFKRCHDCGMLQLSPAPDVQRQLWYIETSEALRHWRENMPDSVRASRAKLYEERVRYVCEHLDARGVTPRRMLEVGAGNGEFAQALLAARGDQVERMVLVEPQPLSLELPRIEWVATPLENWATEQQFDLAISWEVIEHILDPDPMLTALKRRLTRGGLLILSTPNEDSLETRLLLQRSANLLYDHVRLYNPRTLARLLERHGFEILEITTPGRFDVEIIQREYAAGRLDLSDQPALQFLMEDGFRHRADFQRFLCDKLQSGHMRCVARRSD
jgi:2-polyprenyl-3-methyl-5-hydroxy-6-metoxy-1,4-benzoquinol methylase